jgi:hypothetical protein
MTGTLLFREEQDAYTCTLTRDDRALFLQMGRDGFTALSEHVAVGYPTPEGPCSVLHDGRYCVSAVRLFRQEPLGPQEAAAYLRAEWEARWGEDLSSDRG